MPLVTLTLRRGAPREFKRAVLDGVHRALVEVGVPPTDRFQRVLELDDEDFIYDGRYPDLAADRGERFVLIEILWSVGRSVKVKRRLLATLLEALARDPGLPGDQVMLVFKETAWENWSFSSGRLLHAEPDGQVTP